MRCADIMWWSLGILALLILVIRISETIWAKLRQVSAMSRPREDQYYEEQAYWKTSQWRWVPGLKKHLLYAPLWKKRHNSPFRLGLGTLPSRLFIILIVLYLASNVASMLDLKLSNPNRYAVLAELRGRSGTLAVANMVPLVILAGRNNPLIPILKISFDTFNLLHRWLGRIVVAQVLIHTMCWIIPVVADGGWGLVCKIITSTTFATSGTVGAVAMLFLLLLSFSPIRHAFYETFVDIHILLAATAFATTWIHCASADVENGLPQLPWIMAIVYLWFAERLARLVRLLYVNWSGGALTTALCEALPGNLTRVTVHLPRHLSIKPGTHAYIRFWGINAWESHPFSIAWLDQVNGPTSASFLIGAHTGVTRKLFNKASSCSTGVRVRATIEGPYAGYHNLDSYGHVVLFAGSTGITHQLSYIKHLLEGHAVGTVATRRLVLNWVVRDLNSLEWVRQYIDALLQIPHNEDVLHISVFVTRPTNQYGINTIPEIKISRGRPDVSLLVAEEVRQQIGAMCVSVCGAGGLADDVRDPALSPQKFSAP
ncbi:ferric reductase like transmembrane component domain-containing protein [Hirsutella rhossiliensis]|uniref:ferric-chelate reductase (NADPH) n=1 Tax=Hirsutella rhossiliensis TaxID=111463 RepID=A0A9P8SMD8_9HYPO|nr:ferric reductase like transmembrane component domain-containing protein [Hirsutella rhossiliensis]KAH0967906.1 ferric reductase like transmembrane component domain-containing protein [Hirsutella rhossiliensis]